MHSPQKDFCHPVPLSVSVNQQTGSIIMALSEDGTCIARSSHPSLPTEITPPRTELKTVPAPPQKRFIANAEDKSESQSQSDEDFLTL